MADGGHALVVGVDGACDVPEELPAPRTADGSETCCDDGFFFVGGDSWPESESAESESVPDRFLAPLEDADEDDDDDDEPEEAEEDDEPDEEVDEDDNVLWMVVGDGTGGGAVAASSWTSC